MLLERNDRKQERMDIQMETKKKNYIILGVVVLIVVALIVYWQAVPSEEPTVEEPVVEEPVVEEPVEEEPAVEEPVEEEPPAIPAEFSEAPMLRERVERGELPPVEERLPLPEYLKVIEPVEEIGRYGGEIRFTQGDPGIGEVKMMMADTGVRWCRDVKRTIPGVFYGWEISEDGLSTTFFLRKGLRWSDGVPFTTEDIRFWWEDLATDEMFPDITPPGWAFTDGELMTVDFIDRYTFRFNFTSPNWLVPSFLRTGFWNWEPMMAPRHYLEQFHPRYNPEADYATLAEKRMWWLNPDHPTLYAWQMVELEEGVRAVFERNPFYWKVDSDGNQLPYIDRLVVNIVPEMETRLMQFLAGEVDVTFRAHTPLDLPVMLDGAEAAGMRYMRGIEEFAGGWPSMIVNQEFVGDEYVRELLRSRYFRRGLSHALDRDHMNEVLWAGLGRPQQGTAVTRPSPHVAEQEGLDILKEWEQSHLEFNADLANQLLDQAGLDARDPATGFRLRADNGEVFELMLDIGDWGGAAVNEATAGLLESMWEEVGIKTTLNFAPPAEIALRTEEATYMIRIIHIGGEIDIFLWPGWITPSGILPTIWPISYKYYSTGGELGEPPTGPGEILSDLFKKGIAEGDEQMRHRIVWDIMRVHIDEGPFVIGGIGGLPGRTFVRTNMRNVHEFGVLGAWVAQFPGNINPEQWFYEE